MLLSKIKLLYNTLDVSGFAREWISYSALFAHGKNHISGIEHFWNPAKRVYNKISKYLFSPVP